MDTEIENLIEWAKHACEETRAQVGFDDETPDITIPSWLAELEAAIETVESAQ